MVLLPCPFPVRLQRHGQLLAHGLAHRVHALRIDHVELLGDVALGGQGEYQFLEGGVQRWMAQHVAHRGDEARRQQFPLQHAVGGDVQRRVADGLDGDAQREALAGLPAVERVGVVREQREQLRVCGLDVQQHRALKPRSSDGTGSDGTFTNV